MQTDLVMPNRATKRALKVETRTPLEFSTSHSASSYNLGVLLLPNGEMIDGSWFRYMRDAGGVRIEADSPERVCRALGLPPGEHGINKRHDT